MVGVTPGACQIAGPGDTASPLPWEGDPVDAPDDLWKVALYWALERRLFTGSPSLTHDDSDKEDGDTLPPVPRYRFVGVARFDHMPGYVRRNAQIIERTSTAGPPPPGSTSTPIGILN
ncbi:hypothetical protein K0C01_07290 [Salinarchaeum sp. IM2453]|uniref:hypothetical protein n=1 Tax=Salinarchaeum sp. IM2453 TaxID=2862870 RepID=UPI001C82BC58|nr:hypothetical protein [Salinarchaeum sp. IM2453]QZA87614.1 hypothetical protein K0C01_07290 [Salinarchaeum sp. IM2453]